MKQVLLIGLCCLLLAALAACAQPEPQPLRFDPAPWGDGEVSQYQVTDLDGQAAGTARIAIAQSADDSWTIRREVSSQGVQESVSVDVKGSGYRPSTSDLVRSDNSGQEQVHATYNAGQVDLALTTKQNVTTYERVNVPSDARDQRTLLVLARSLPLAEGYATRINSFFPLAGLLDRVTISVVGREDVETPAGVFTTWHIELDNGDRSSEAWIGTEAPYPLVKFVDERTEGALELIEFQAGN